MRPSSWKTILISAALTRVSETLAENSEQFIRVNGATLKAKKSIDDLSEAYNKIKPDGKSGKRRKAEGVAASVRAAKSRKAAKAAKKARKSNRRK